MSVTVHELGSVGEIVAASQGIQSTGMGAIEDVA